jgi:hypothetical protein
MPLLDDLAARLPGCQLGGTGVTRRLIFEIDGVWLDARAREDPFVEIFIRTARLPFQMRIRPIDGDLPAPLPLPFEDLFVVDTDDAFLSGLWLDEPAQAALVGAIWERPGPAIAGFDVHVEDGEVLLRRQRDTDVEQLVRGLRGAAVVASRTHRLAAEWLEVARGLGGTTSADRWDADGGFVATIDRGATQVRIDNVLVLPGEDDDPLLRTRIRARRIAADGDRWALWQHRVARRHRPRVDADADVDHDKWSGVAADPQALLARLRPLQNLLADANPDVLSTAGDEVSLWYTGLVTSPIWLGPAVELIARLAIEIGTVPSGPYR